MDTTSSSNNSTPPNNQMQQIPRQRIPPGLQQYVPPPPYLAVAMGMGIRGPPYYGRSVVPMRRPTGGIDPTRHRRAIGPNVPTLLYGAAPGQPRPPMRQPAVPTNGRRRTRPEPGPGRLLSAPMPPPQPQSQRNIYAEMSELKRNMNRGEFPREM